MPGQMTTRAKVQRARNQQEALLIIAEALDRIERSVNEAVPPSAEHADSWNAWSAPSATLEELQAQLAGAVGDERVALEAKRRLLTDPGAIIEQPDEGRATHTEVVDVDCVTTIPAPSAERAALRRRVAEAHDFPSFVRDLEPENFLAAYAQGGPMWLYLYDRDAVIAMPIEWRRAMVSDIEQDSPQQAKEFARDVLKDAAPGEPDA